MSDWQDYNNPNYPNTVSGSLRLLPELYSPQLGNARSILVYLPRSYHNDIEKRYPVIYMQDGENLFDEQLAFGEEWHVDETLQQLAEEGHEAIVVGIPNNDERFDEYSPFVDQAYGGGRGDEYLTFIIETVKPLIDVDFRTQPSRNTTGILGSSMGALISLYGFFRFPEIFGFAGALSPAIWFSENAFMLYLQNIEQPPQGKLYLDTGWQELSGGEDMSDKSEEYANLVRQLRDILTSKGYILGNDLMYVEDEIGAHSEGDWARRLPNALRFLLPTT